MVQLEGVVALLVVLGVALYFLTLTKSRILKFVGEFMAIVTLPLMDLMEVLTVLIVLMLNSLNSEGTSALPAIIQGGMGAGVSNWELAGAVSQLGQLGVISGTALDTILIRRLQDGDPDGSMRRGLAAFPYQDMVASILDKWFIEGGKAEDEGGGELHLDYSL